MRFIPFIVSILIQVIFVINIDAKDLLQKWGNDSVYSEEYGIMGGIKLQIFENGINVKNIGIILLDTQECNKYNNTPMLAPSIIINGTKVQMLAQCVSNGVRMDFPKTSAGINYLVSELKKRNYITYKQENINITFSAKGFTKSWNSYESKSGGL